MRLPRLRLVGRAVETGAVLLPGLWCGWMTYLAAPRLLSPDLATWTHPALAVVAGGAVALMVLGGTWCARGAGAHAAWQGIPLAPPSAPSVPAGADEAAEMLVAEPVEMLVAEPTEADFRRLGEVLAAELRPDDCRGMEGRGVIALADLVGRRVPGLDEETVTAFVGDYVMVRAGLAPTSGRDWLGALALAERVTGPDDPRWPAAVRRMAEVLISEIRPEDGNLAGRGVSQVAAATAARVPELGKATVQDFVRDFMEVRAGYEPKSGRYWGDALAGLTRKTRGDLVVALVASRRGRGMPRQDLVEQFSRLGIEGRLGFEGLVSLADDVVRQGRLEYSAGWYTVVAPAQVGGRGV